jgi:hypothetical protein
MERDPFIKGKTGNKAVLVIHMRPQWADAMRAKTRLSKVGQIQHRLILSLPATRFRHRMPGQIHRKPSKSVRQGYYIEKTKEMRFWTFRQEYL